MIPGEIQLIVDEVLVAVRHFTRAAYGIAVGGAHAKGAEDAESDLDIYLFSEDALPSAERESRVLELCPGAQDIVSWAATFCVGFCVVSSWLRNGCSV